MRSQTLLAAKAHGRVALDSVYLDIKDLDGLGREVDDAVAVGFDAKVAIHPSQVAVIRAGYAPTPDQVDWARQVLAAARDERGVFQYGGRWSMPSASARRTDRRARIDGRWRGAIREIGSPCDFGGFTGIGPGESALGPVPFFLRDAAGARGAGEPTAFWSRPPLHRP